MFEMYQNSGTVWGGTPAEIGAF